MIAVVLSSLLILAGPRAPRPAADPSGARTVALANGLTVLLAPDANAVAVDLGVWYRAGTRYEKPGRSGVAQMFGHLMFRGSRRHPAGEHARLLRAEGASFGTVINPDYACFTETLPPGSLGLAIELEADRMRGLAITPDKLEAERSLLNDEQSGRERESLLSRGLEELYAVSFAGDPYGRPVSGLAEDLPRITLDDVTAFYRSRFAPENAMVTVVGRFDPATTLAAIRRAFGAIPRVTPLPAKGRPRPGSGERPVPAQHGDRRVTIAAPAQAPILVAGWRAPGYADPDGPALEVLSRILSGGSSTRLTRDLSRMGVRVQGGLDRSREASLLYCIAATPPKADTMLTEHALVHAVEEIAARPIAPGELERARHQLESDFLFGWQEVHSRATALGVAQFVGGDYRAAWRGLERIQAVTMEDVRRAAERVLKSEGRTVVWIMPGESDEGNRPSRRRGRR